MLRITTLWALFVCLDALTQLLFKSAAVRLPEPSLSLEWAYRVVSSIRVWAALTCLAFVFAIWMLILQKSPLGKAFPLTASTYVLVAIGSRFLFDETLVPLQYAGIALIVAGVAMLRPGR